MLTVILVFSALISTNNTETLLTLDYPALGFEYLAPEFISPTEGELTEQAGVVVSLPNSTGVEYRLHYWQEDLPPGTRIEEDMYGKLLSVLSPDLLDYLVYGGAEWMEGSTEASNRNTSSVGLVSSLNFNIITDEGVVQGAGRGYVIINNGYTILF